MTNFLGLPAEIRARILEYAVYQSVVQDNPRGRGGYLPELLFVCRQFYVDAYGAAQRVRDWWRLYR
jgi:hypothetical protein